MPTPGVARDLLLSAPLAPAGPVGKATGMTDAPFDSEFTRLFN